MMYELNWCGIYRPIWLVCLILGGLLSVIVGKLVELLLRHTNWKKQEDALVNLYGIS